MTTASAKAKGRALQQLVRDALRIIGVPFGLVEDDIKSTSMGVSGVDVLLSPAAKKALGNLTVECKNQESLNVTGIFFQHEAKYPGSLPILVHKRNKTRPLVTLLLADFVNIYQKGLLNV